MPLPVSVVVDYLMAIVTAMVLLTASMTARMT